MPSAPPCTTPASSSRSAAKPLCASEKGIREAHERLTLALDVSGLGTWDRDLATNKIVWSEGMYRIFGRTPRSVLRQAR